MNPIRKFAAAAFAFVLTAACYSAYYPYDRPVHELRGTVDRLDLRDGSLKLVDISEPAGGRWNAREGVRIYFDRRTPVSYAGRTFGPEQLEPGDQVAVQFSRAGGRMFARSMTVIYDISSRGPRPTEVYPAPRDNNYAPPPSYAPPANADRGPMVRGVVRDVDSTRQWINVDRGDGSTTAVAFDDRTSVLFEGRNYQPSQLERGDEIEIQLAGPGERPLARQITVIRSASH